MAGLNDMRKRLRVIKVKEALSEVLEESRADLIEAQRAQLFSGLDSNGDRIVPPYAPTTVKRKQRKGLPHDRVTGFETGSMHDAIYVYIQGSKFRFFSNSSTANPFTKRYGNVVWGLNPQSMDKLSLESQGKLINKLRRKLGL